MNAAESVMRPGVFAVGHNGSARRAFGDRRSRPAVAGHHAPALPCTADTYMDDLMRVTENLSEPELADLLVNRSRETVVWMREKGVRWIPMFKRQSYLVNGIQHFFGGMAVEAVGGGWGLVDFL